MTQQDVANAVLDSKRNATIVAWEKDKSPAGRGALRLLADLTSDPEAVFHWLEVGGDEPKVKPKAGLDITKGRWVLAEEGTAHAPEGFEGSESLLERQKRIAGNTARVLGSTVKVALESLPPTAESRLAIAEALHAFAVRMSRERTDVSGMLAVEELLRRGEM
jgi:hypothetical protein